jgi:hypothetical protein
MSSVEPCNDVDDAPPHTVTIDYKAYWARASQWFSCTDHFDLFSDCSPSRQFGSICKVCNSFDKVTGKKVGTI